MIYELIGSLTAIYTAAQLAAGECPKLGTLFFDRAAGKKYIFLQNSGATAITASLAAVALGTDKTNFKCSLAAATDALEGFAGVRPVSSESMAQDECGWFQIGGQGSFLHSGGAAVSADAGIVTSATVAGKVEGQADSAAGNRGAFGLAVAAKTLLDEVVLANIVKNVWGL